MSAMDLLVLGGTGFIGPYVVRRLCGDGHRVSVVHRGKTEAVLPPDVRHVHVGDTPRGDRSWLAGAARIFAAVTIASSTP